MYKDIYAHNSLKEGAFHFRGCKVGRVLSLMEGIIRNQGFKTFEAESTATVNPYITVNRGGAGFAGKASGSDALEADSKK